MSQSKKGNAKNKEVSTLKATQSSLSSTENVKSGDDGFLFGKRNFMFMFAGIALIALGMLLMSGGHMPDANTWDEGIIYSTRRTLIAPIVILAGLGVQFYAIFAKK